MAGVFTLTSNGRLMKPQFLNEEGKLQDWTSSNTTIGSSSKRKYDHLPNHFEKYEELYSSHDWTKFSEYKRVFTYYCASIDLENTKAEAVKNSFFGPVRPQVPASILQFHQDVTLVVNEEAYSLCK